MTTPNLTPSWVAREERSFSVLVICLFLVQRTKVLTFISRDLFPHIPAINSHIRARNHDESVPINEEKSLKIQTEKVQEIPKTKKKTEIIQKKTPTPLPSSPPSTPFSCIDSNQLLEELERELLALTERVNSNPLFKSLNISPISSPTSSQEEDSSSPLPQPKLSDTDEKHDESQKKHKKLQEPKKSKNSKV